jgi:transcriptional regulator with XRE-family HTH domain
MCRVAELDVANGVRRIRRMADLSQRQLAETCRISQSLVARAEAGKQDVLVGLLGRMAAVAGLRLAMLDDTGAEIGPMDGDAVRDGAGRRFPAHLDTRYGDVDWWHGVQRYSREQPWYTFDRSRDLRDGWRGRSGTPDDHQLPQPGDSPQDRAAARRLEAERRRRAEHRRRWEAGELRRCPEWVCDCPPGCADQDTGELPAHVPGCPCECDVD